MKRSWACAPLSCSDPLQLGPSALYETLARVQKDDTPKSTCTTTWPGRSAAVVREIPWQSENE